MEPFDEALDRQIWSLADSRLGWHKSLAPTRRTVPREVESTLREFHGRSQQETSMDNDTDMDVDESMPVVDLSIGDAGTPSFCLCSARVDDCRAVLAERHERVDDALMKAAALAGELAQVGLKGLVTLQVLTVLQNMPTQTERSQRFEDVSLDVKESSS